MLKRSPILIMLMMVLSTQLFAQDPIKGEHFIEVTGTADMEIEPDEIVLFIKLKEFENNRQKIALEKIDQEFLQALKAANIDSKKLALSGVGSTLAYVGKHDNDAFREKSYQLILTSAAELERFVEKLQPVKVNQAYISRLRHTNMEKFKLDLKIKALQAAHAKAEVLLKSIGSEIGRPLVVREFSNDPLPGYPVYQSVANTLYSPEAGAAEGGSIGFQKIKLREQVSAQFEIK